MGWMWVDRPGQLPRCRHPGPLDWVHFLQRPRSVDVGGGSDQFRFLWYRVLSLLDYYRSRFLPFAYDCPS